MNLYGWNYTGRNIGPELHRQYKIMVDCLLDPMFTNNAKWGWPIQTDLAKRMHLSSSGAVRTVKKICEDFGFFNNFALNSTTSIDANRVLTDRGKMIYQAATLEEQIKESGNYKDALKDKIFVEIKNLYEEVYCDALRDYYLRNSDGTKLHPLRATLKALNRYNALDKWEWYLLNTFIRHDDDCQEEALLDEYISRYRDGEFLFSMDDVKGKPKGHQYIPQYFEFAGLVCVVQRPKWYIRDSGNHNELKSEVLSSVFLNKLYGRSI